MDSSIGSSCSDDGGGGLRPYRVLLCASGSVAALKLPILAQSLLDLNTASPGTCNFEVRAVVTEHALHFFRREELPAGVPLYTDAEEWAAWRARGDPVLHIELGKWAHAMLIAPLDANTLAKMAHGLCDNLLTCTARAWDLDKPLLFCPAMNTRMWRHPVTAAQTAALRSWGHTEVPCVTKTLVCGDTGEGAMAEPHTILRELRLCADRARASPHFL